MTRRTYLRYLQYILVIIIVSLIAYHTVTAGTTLDIFLTASLLLILYSLVNLLYVQYSDAERMVSWRRYSVLLLLAMIFGSLGDFAMPGIFLLPTDIAFINGILYFAIGHVFYLLALKKSSPLLFDTRMEYRSLKRNNLIVWIVSIIIVIILFQLTVYNPSDQIVSIGAFGYGILLVSALAFAITKWFDEYPLYFKVALILGFSLFFISDWVLGIRYLGDSSLMSGTAFVGVTYAIGQLLIQSSVLFGLKKGQTTAEI